MHDYLIWHYKETAIAMSTIYFVTNRRPTPKDDPKSFGGDFHQDGLAVIRFGQAEVKGKSISFKAAPETITLNADGTAVDADKSEFGSTQTFDEIRKLMQENRNDTLVFVHGYNVSFRDALSAAGELKDKLKKHGKDINMVLFSWPSDGSAAPYLAYSNDRRDAEASGAALARAMLKFADFITSLKLDEHCQRDVHLLCHSMGNYVLRHAVQEFLYQTSRRIPRLFGQIFMMAADEDNDAFEHDHKLQQLPKLARRVNVYFNREDRAMAISDITKLNPDRLGDDGPRLPFNLPAKVTQIDCTEAVTEGFIEHSYYKDSDPVIDDVIHVLNRIEPQDVPNRRFVSDRNSYIINRLKTD
jgi:esterase/lipase superfamily enzyme